MGSAMKLQDKAEKAERAEREAKEKREKEEEEDALAVAQVDETSNYVLVLSTNTSTNVGTKY